MTNFLEHLNHETLPPAIVEAFVNWCVWEQARPALLKVLEATGLNEHAEQVRYVTTYTSLAHASELAGHDAHEARTRTGPLGLSTAEAAAFLVARIAKAATEAEWDPEGVAFFAAQVWGWAAFAESNFADAAKKAAAEQQARTDQEQRLVELWQHRD